MLIVMENLPVELVGMNVLSYPSLKDIVLLERACGSKISHQLFLNLIPYCPPVVLPTKQHNNREALDWFVYKRCKLSSLTIKLSGDNPCLHVENLQVEYFDLEINSSITIQILKSLFESNIAYWIRSVYITGDQNREVMEQLSSSTRNLKQLKMHYAYNCMDWLNSDILAKWKLTEIHLEGTTVTSSFLTLIAQTCTELTNIALDSKYTDDAAVIAIAQHCPKLETLLIGSHKITYSSLLALSERGLPLKELDIQYIPYIPTEDIARRCRHALSCIRHLDTYNLLQNGQDANILIPYMTGLTSVYLDYYSNVYIPLLTQYCHKLTEIEVHNKNYHVTDILSLCRANPLLQEVWYCARVELTDTLLIELIHACPHLHTLRLPHDTNITDRGILTLSQHCTQLQSLDIRRCDKVTEAAVLQLLQRCRKVTGLYISSSSLSEETWTQLDNNIKKRVSRW